MRVKKRDGNAVFSSKGLRWTPFSDNPAADVADAQAKPIVVSWSSVLDQQVSSLSSPRAMIRLRLSNNAVLVLEFIGSRTIEEAFELREQAKAFIARCLQTSGGQRPHSGSHSALCNPNEIKQRAALLAANSTLKRQHTEMVNEGLISEEDFWASRRHLIANEASKRQKVGKTSAILTDMASANDTSGNVVKYNLNAEVIHQIFIQYPAVHLAYQAQVPDKMTETEFWGAFFKSKYFHRDRKNGGHEDMFTKYEEKEMEMRASSGSVDPRGLVDPLVDLTSTEEDLVGPQPQQVTKKLRDGKEDPLSLTIAKFNRHGAYVLDPAHAGKFPQVNAADGAAKAANTTTRPSYHDSLQEATQLDDLQGEVPPPYTPLTLEDESRYFQQHTETAKVYAVAQEAPLDAWTHFQQVCRSPFALEAAFPNAKLSLAILAEVNSNAEATSSSSSSFSGGSSASLPNNNGSVAADFIPNDFKKQVYNLFHDVCELMRHFFSFKDKVARGGSDEAKRKLGKIKDKMGAKYDELVKIREALPPHEKNLLAPLLKPFDDQLNLAFI